MNEKEKGYNPYSDKNKFPTPYCYKNIAMFYLVEGVIKDKKSNDKNGVKALISKCKYSHYDYSNTSL